MPSKRPKPRPKARKRSRRSVPKISPTFALWALFVANIWAGASYSPLTKTYRVRTQGVPEYDRARITSILNSVDGVPSAQVNKRKIESEILQNSLYYGAEYSLNIFGRGILKCTQIPPVAKVKSADNLWLFSDGMVAKLPGFQPTGLPQVVPPTTSSTPSSLVVATWESTKTAELCISLKNYFPVTSWTVSVDDSGVISLLGDPSGVVILGSSENLDEKLKKLRDLMQEDPKILQQYSEINLTVPAQPMKVPRGVINPKHD